MKWIVETLNELVDEEIASLPKDMKARFVRVVELIESVGLENVREPHIKHIELKAKMAYHEPCTSQPTRKELSY
ncbi:hypothetical protein KIH87_01865 [Paraneptunicella aestuarii]|uniref:hypothetical protein n=1 Tax=Paraneptunicella aestuarii TaxID=2831148 RepID=UPI001E4ACB85|nr:hypothetical protein [Paraneptunicella aestuarii]UAA40893.1 hypothetical protein KIH87_01865 [Paraneptunicella aestuarii]